MRRWLSAHGPAAHTLPGLLVLALCPLAATAAHAIGMVNTPDGCTVTTGSYRLVVDATGLPFVRMLSPDGAAELARLDGPWLEQDGRRFVAAANPAPHFHPLRSGAYLVELHLENIILSDAAGAWPGLAEISLYCHEDRAYLVVAALCQEGEWVNRGMYVYRTPEDHRACPQLSPGVLGFALSGLSGTARPCREGAVCGESSSLGLRMTSPEGQAAPQLDGSAAVFELLPADTPWLPGSVHEVGGLAILAPTGAEAESRLIEEALPLPAEAFSMEMGDCVGYEPTKGLYELVAQTSGTPDPPRGLRAGTRFTIRNDQRARRVLVDQRDPWGGISGGIVRDGAGEPIPVVVQFGLNFPELHAEAGEPGWATLTYPLDLEPDRDRVIHGEHLYRALTDRDVIYLTSLDNIGDPLLLQTTVGRTESHTLTTGAYPWEFLPGNELRINDFRRIYSQVRVRSVSAILPTFFGYWDEAGEYQGLMPGTPRMRETSPFLAEYTVDAATRDGAVSGQVRLWQAPHDDMSRVFTEVSLQVYRDVRLAPPRPQAGYPASLFLLRHHAFNPMAFMRYAYTQPDGSTHEGELTHARTVAANGAALGEFPLACLYRAANALDEGLPCSDITGNAGFVLLDWDVRIGGVSIRPGCYAFCTGAGDVPDGDYARDVAIVPTEPVTELPAGSTIRYRAVHMVWGDNSSGLEIMERERERWALRPLSVRAGVGEVISADPPEVRARDGAAEVELTGGYNWVPVRVRGLRPGLPLRVTQTDALGRRELGPGAPGEPWYAAWPDGEGTCGFTFLVALPAGAEAVRVEVRQ